MPEGDTVRRLADRISARFVGERCIRSIARDPRIVHLDLAGSTLVETDAVGKWLLLRFDDESGWMTAVDMPVIGVVATADEESVVGHLGPDLCGPSVPDIEAIVARLVEQPDRPLAAAVLDQRNVAGFGNVYAVETPFIAGVSPLQPVGSIDGLDLLVRAGSALIRTNAERGPQNTTGRRLHEAHHWVYGRRRQPCPWCSTRLEGMSERNSPWHRVTTWCPSCQTRAELRTVDPAPIERALTLHPARKRYPVETADDLS